MYLSLAFHNGLCVLALDTSPTSSTILPLGYWPQPHGPFGRTSRVPGTLSSQGLALSPSPAWTTVSHIFSGYQLLLKDSPVTGHIVFLWLCFASTFFIHPSPSELPWVTLSYSYFGFQVQWFWWIKSLWQRSKWPLAMLSLRKQITPWWDHLTTKPKQLPHDRNWSCSPYMGTISSWWEWNRPSSNEDFPGALQSRSRDNNQQDHDLTKTTCSASFATSTYADPQICLCSPFL